MTNKNIIAFQGVAGAHSDVACQIAYPYHKTLPCKSFEDVFEAVENADAELGLIPIENSYAGRVAEIHQILPHTSLQIVSEYFHEVHHHLMAPKGARLTDIKSVHSHQQALMQCHDRLLEMGVERELFSDTAAAAKAVSKWDDNTKAALASNLSAELYGLEILQEDMQDADQDNHTLFVAFSKEPYEAKKGDKLITSILFTTRNIPAGLYKALGGFSTNGVNLLKLESYIPDYKKGTAQFFATFEGSLADENVKRAIEELGFFTSEVRVLGEYPADGSRG